MARTTGALLLLLLASASAGGRSSEPQQIRVTITSTENPGQKCAGDAFPDPCAALSELQLFDENGTASLVRSIFQDPAGYNPNGEGPTALLDGDTTTKWLDYNWSFTPSAVVVELANGAARPTALDLYTARDARKRHPKSWTVESKDICGAWAQIASVSDIVPPDYQTSYASVNGGEPFALAEPPYRDDAYCLTSRAFRLVFSAVRTVDDGVGGVQLMEVELYDTDGRKLNITAASNPERDAAVDALQNPSQGAEMAVDGSSSTKWFDASIRPSGGTATLQLEVATLATVGSYVLFTAGDNEGRDPTAWSFQRQAHDGSWVTTAVVANPDPPLNRSAAYPAYYGEGPPPSPPPPPPPSLVCHPA